MNYYNIQKNWSKIKPHLDNEELKKILVNDFNKYTYGRWERLFEHGMYPFEFESCDWASERRFCQYFKYVKHGACHWLVNFNLHLAKLVEPKRNWIIITSKEHSTVWDGKDTIFDFNFFAFGIPADECFELANQKKLEGKLKVHFAEHYSTL